MIALAADAGTGGIPVGVYLFTLLTLTAGIVTAAKGRYLWLALGLFLLGVPWLVSALMVAKPGSAWARTLYGPEKMSRAERRAGRRIPL